MLRKLSGSTGLMRGWCLIISPMRSCFQSQVMSPTLICLNCVERLNGGFKWFVLHADSGKCGRNIFGLDRTVICASSWFGILKAVVNISNVPHMERAALGKGAAGANVKSGQQVDWRSSRWWWSVTDSSCGHTKKLSVPNVGNYLQLYNLYLCVLGREFKWDM